MSLPSHHPRPGARGSRHAKQLARQQRFQMSLYQMDVISQYKDIHMTTQAEATTCPYCGQAVHPTNLKKHLHLRHWDTVVTDVGNVAVQIGSVLYRRYTAKPLFTLKAEVTEVPLLPPGKTIAELQVSPKSHGSATAQE